MFGRITVGQLRHKRGDDIARTGTEQLCKRYLQDRVPLGSILIRGC